MKIKDFSYNDRPREKALNRGIESLSDAELLAVLIRSGTKEKSAIELSYEIIKNFNGLSGLKDAFLEDLLSIKGIGKAKALSILSSIEFSRRFYSNYEKNVKIKSIEQIYNIFLPLVSNKTYEMLYIACLDSKQHLIKYECLYKGGLNEHIIHPRDIFKTAIKLNSAAIILIHNHPSGDSSPSQNDILTTKEIFNLSKELGIPLIDHIIIGNGNYTSLKLNHLF